MVAPPLRSFCPYKLCHCKRGNSLLCLCFCSVLDLPESFCHSSERRWLLEVIFHESRNQQQLLQADCVLLCNRYQFWLLLGTMHPYVFLLLWTSKGRIMNALFKKNTMIWAWFNVCGAFCKEMELGHAFYYCLLVLQNLYSTSVAQINCILNSVCVYIHT